MFIREKRIDCGRNYTEIDLVPRTDMMEQGVKGLRQPRRELTRPVQARLNWKNSIRWLTQITNANFGKGDLGLTLTHHFVKEPSSIKEAEKIVDDLDKKVTNFIERIRYHAKKQGGDVKYVRITEYKVDKDGLFKIRPHHHLTISTCLDRDFIEELWSTGRGKNKKSLGRCNTIRLQPNQRGIEEWTRYISKDMNRKRRWSTSQNLKRPTRRDRDHAYTPRLLERLANSNDLGQEYFEKMYPNHFVTDIWKYHSDYTGDHLYVKLWRKPEKGAVKGFDTKLKTIIERWDEEET